MNSYVTGEIIKKLREEKKMTQLEFARKLSISDKAVSKWENGKGYPDITLIEPIAEALGISAIELLSGNNIVNRNRNANMLRSKWYVCPICGNVINTTGEAVISCCGVTLPSLEPIETDEEHAIHVEKVEDEYYVTVDHDMTKSHYISFIAALSGQENQIVKLYPEGAAEARFKTRLVKRIVFYCNHHGLYEIRV